MLPNFIIIGAQKAGTTSLYENICKHPKINRCAIDEGHYFNRYNYFENDEPKPKGLKWYKSLFAAGDGHITGEKTPAYSALPLIPARIEKVVPDVRLIMSVRNPVDRAYSQYVMERRRNSELMSFCHAIIANEYKHMYISRGYYASQIKNFLRYFDRGQLFIVDFAMLSQHCLYEQIFRFLGLEQVKIDISVHRKAKKYPDMNPVVEDFLYEYYREPNEELFDFLGQDLGWNRRKS